VNASASDLAERIVQAKGSANSSGMQAEFVQLQIQVFNEQVKDLGETGANAAETAAKADRKTNTA
jgi:hypothetical protein